MTTWLAVEKSFLGALAGILSSPVGQLIVLLILGACIFLVYKIAHRIPKVDVSFKTSPKLRKVGVSPKLRKFEKNEGKLLRRMFGDLSKKEGEDIKELNIIKREETILHQIIKLLQAASHSIKLYINSKNPAYLTQAINDAKFARSSLAKLMSSLKKLEKLYKEEVKEEKALKKDVKKEIAIEKKEERIERKAHDKLEIQIDEREKKVLKNIERSLKEEEKLQKEEKKIIKDLHKKLVEINKEISKGIREIKEGNVYGADNCFKDAITKIHSLYKEIKELEQIDIKELMLEKNIESLENRLKMLYRREIRYG